MSAIVRPQLVRVGLTATALAALLLAGCAGNNSTGDFVTGQEAPQSQEHTGGSDSSAPARASGGLTSPDAGKVGGSSVVGSSVVASRPGTTVGADVVSVLTTDRKLARSADLTIRVEAIPASSAGVREVAAGLGGYVADEEVGDADTSRSSVPDGTFGDRALIVISVPATQLDTALARLAKTGVVTRRSTASVDVTKQYVDTTSRVKTMKASVDRLRALMARTQDVKQITALESALTTREATLESVTSQLSALQSQVAMSTITVTLSTTATPPAPPAKAPSGFGAGLSAGWHALVLAVTALLTVLGILLPFLVPAALVAAPFVLWLRRHRRIAAPAMGHGAS